MLGIDIDIRPHNKEAVLAHPMAKRIEMIQGSSIAPDIAEKVKQHAAKAKTVFICLDSNHTHDHVLEELKLYAPLLSKGSYCIVFDTIVEDMPDGYFQNRPWDKGNNPKTAVFEYLKILEKENIPALDGERLKMEIDKAAFDKLLISVAPDGFLKRV